MLLNPRPRVIPVKRPRFSVSASLVLGCSFGGYDCLHQLVSFGIKRHNAVLGEVKDNISFESCMELCNAPLSSLTELFLNGALGREAEKSSRVLHDKVTRKAVTMQKKQQKPSKKIQFSQLAPWRQVLRNSDSQPSKTLSGKGSSLFFFFFFSRQILLPLLASSGRGKSFEGSLPPSQLQVGGILSQHWHSWHSCRVENWAVEVLHSVYLVPFHHLPPELQEPPEFPSYFRNFNEKWTRCW